jgi:membrane protein implicated in regulation of membrane protease activity
MRTWLALLGAPSAVLAALSADYALVTPACAWRTLLPLGSVTGTALLFSVVATLLAWQRWRPPCRRGPRCWRARQRGSA